ncbi:37S ribosomal protein S24, mitochondrial [Blastocladiella emersonii ATCC 22665]|nr:37S ribosomal protein S24, mitochondrial [Blastocladiella emersonii ATCC 22665]
MLPSSTSCLRAAARRAATATRRAATATTTQRSLLHTSTVSLARRPQSSQNAQAAGHPEMDAVLEHMSLSPPKTYREDGISGYQARMVTEAVLVRSYMEKVHYELPELKAALQPAAYTPPPKAAYLRFRTVDHPADPTHPMARKVTLTVSLCELVHAEQLTPAAKHTLLLLAGPRYNPVDGVITMAEDRFPYRAQNKAFAADTFAELLRQAKANADTYADVPLDLRHAAKKVAVRDRKRKLQFPKEWLLQAQAAPEAAAAAEAVAVPAATEAAAAPAAATEAAPAAEPAAPAAAPAAAPKSE